MRRAWRHAVNAERSEASHVQCECRGIHLCPEWGIAGSG